MTPLRIEDHEVMASEGQTILEAAAAAAIAIPMFCHPGARELDDIVCANFHLTGERKINNWTTNAVDLIAKILKTRSAQFSSIID